MYLSAPFILQNFYKKNLRVDSGYEDLRHFWDQNSPFVLNKDFLVQIIVTTFIYLWPFSLCKILKKSYNGSRIMTTHHFWAQSGPFASNNIFSENLLMSLVSFIHAYLHAKNQSQILIY